MTHVEAGSGHGQLQRVGQTQAKQTSDREAGVEVVPCPGADLRLGGVGSVDEHLFFGVGRTGVLNRMNDHDRNPHLFADRAGE